MVTSISAGGIVMWLAWGFFMGIGWSVGSWLVGKILGAIG